jgi:predicted deacetylase
MKAIISIHDVSPCFRNEIEIILKELEGIKKTFLITPMWNGDNPLNEDFSMMLAEEELALHGLTHKTRKKDYFGNILLMSSGSFKEFYQLNKTETRQKIETAVKLFEDSFRKTPTGFVPPMWHHNKYTLEVLKELGFDYTESLSAFINLRMGKQTFSIPICFDFGHNKFLTCVSVYGWRYFFKHLQQPLVRLSIHPADIKNGCWPDTLEMINWLKAKNYTFLYYNELLGN